jgi:hypothetical protein
MRPDTRRLLLTLAVVWTAAAAVIGGMPVGVTAPLGLVLLALPGLVWLRALRPGGSSGLEAVTAVAAVDLALLVATAFVLDALPGGLRASSWAVALAVLSTGGLAVVWARDDATRRSDRLPDRPSARQALLLAGGAVALAVAGTISIVSAHTSVEEHFTQLSLVPRGAPGHSTSASLVITNHEGRTLRYRFAYTTGTRTTIHHVRLEAGDSFRRVEPVAAGAAAVTLYRGSSKAPYRQVWIGDPQGRPQG